MIRVTVEIKVKWVSERLRITAPSIERTLHIAGEGIQGREARVVFPIDPDAFFARSETTAEPLPEPPDFPEAA